MSTQPATPECEKLAKVSEESNKIGAFLDWLKDKGIHLATWEYDEDLDDERLFPHREPIQNILAEYYGIDLDKVETERRALLDWIQEQNND